MQPALKNGPRALPFVNARTHALQSALRNKLTDSPSSDYCDAKEIVFFHQKIIALLLFFELAPAPQSSPQFPSVPPVPRSSPRLRASA